MFTQSQPYISRVHRTLAMISIVHKLIRGDVKTNRR